MRATDHLPSIADLNDGFSHGRLKVRDVIVGLLDAIDRQNPAINAYVRVFHEQALDAADRADAEMVAGHRRGVLHGIPVALKDNIAVAGTVTACGSALFAERQTGADAAIVRQLKDAGAIILGKTAMHELAWGIDGANPFFGDTLNPLDPESDCGGSSGGSAAAVAAGLASIAFGTDTACSIRFPAHCCGVVGFKPGFDVLSLEGVTPLVDSMDHLGLFARTIGDARLAMQGLGAGTAALAARQSALRVGLLRPLMAGCTPEIEAAMERTVERLRACGMDAIDVNDVPVEKVGPLTRALFAEALGHFETALQRQPDCFSPQLRDKLTRKFEITAAEYLRARQERRQFAKKLDCLSSGFDVLLAPAAQTLAMPLRGYAPDYAEKAYRNATVFNLSRQPSLSLPYARLPSGRFFGLMLSARRGCDLSLLAAADVISAIWTDGVA